MLQSADVSAANWKTWLVTIALTLIAFIAGHGLVTPFCYAWGRLFLPGSRDLAAYSPRMGVIAGLALFIMLIWSAFWLRRARRIWRQPIGLLHVALPLIVFAWAAWRGLSIGYPCNPL